MHIAYSRFLFLAAIFACSMGTASAAIAQTSPSPADSIGPLDARTVERTDTGMSYEDAADSINRQVAQVQQAQSEPSGLDLRELPLIGELLDEDGNVGFVNDIPLSVDFNDMEGGTSVVLEEQFTVE